jgi:hypothetical protein
MTDSHVPDRDDLLPEETFIGSAEPTSSGPATTQSEPDSAEEFGGRFNEDTNFRTPDPDDTVEREDVRKHIEGE